MVFSTVQISMPGTSCARAVADIARQGASSRGVTRAIRPSLEIFMRVAPHPGQFVASPVEDIIRNPHSRVEVLRSVPPLRRRIGMGAINRQRRPENGDARTTSG